jgi:hypothetical protein
MRATIARAAGVVALAALLAGCGSSGAQPDAAGPVRYREVEYHALVYNPGTPRGFAAFTTTTRQVTIDATSAARIETVASTPPELPPAGRTQWQAAGRPALSGNPVKGQTLTFAAGQFSFLPQGRTMTYQQVRSLPPTPAGVLSAVRAHLASSVGADPPTSLILKQLGFLLGVAPLPPAVRTAAWQSVLGLPGLRDCGAGLCAADDGYETQLLVDRTAKSTSVVRQRLLRPSTMFPAVSAGTLVESDTFLR